MPTLYLICTVLCTVDPICNTNPICNVDLILAPQQKLALHVMYYSTRAGETTFYVFEYKSPCCKYSK